MTSTISTNIGNLNFILDENAYTKLQAYLAQLDKYFDKNPDKSEILADMEISLADKFTNSLTKNKQIINLTDVNAAIGSLGSIDDFDKLAEPVEVSSSNSSEQADSDVQTDQAPLHFKTEKKLFRDNQDKIIAGLCAGLSSYFGWQIPTVRIVTIILALIPFAGILIVFAYAIAARIVPITKTASDRLLMTGESVTLENLEKVITDRSNEASSESQRLIGLLKKILAWIIVIAAAFALLAGFATVCIFGFLWFTQFELSFLPGVFDHPETLNWLFFPLSLWFGLVVVIPVLVMLNSSFWLIYNKSFLRLNTWIYLSTLWLSLLGLMVLVALGFIYLYFNLN